MLCLHREASPHVFIPCGPAARVRNARYDQGEGRPLPDLPRGDPYIGRVRRECVIGDKEEAGKRVDMCGRRRDEG